MFVVSVNVFRREIVYVKWLRAAESLHRRQLQAVTLSFSVMYKHSPTSKDSKQMTLGIALHYLIVRYYFSSPVITDINIYSPIISKTKFYFIWPEFIFFFMFAPHCHKYS